MKFLLIVIASGILIPIVPIWIAFFAPGYHRFNEYFLFGLGIAIALIEVLILTWLTPNAPLAPIGRFLVFAIAAFTGAIVIAYLLWKFLLDGYAPGK